MKILTKISIIIFLASSFFGCTNTNEEETTPDEFDEAITVTDADGNVYNTVTIGDQIWTVENLKTTKYNDGTPIVEWQFGMDWFSLIEKVSMYQWADTSDLNDYFDEELPFDHYGALYNYFAIQTGKLAPEGWRIPSVQDFKDLENYLKENGFEDNVIAPLKLETGWSDFEKNGTNESGFNALPTGYVSAGGTATGAASICILATSNADTVDINSSSRRTNFAISTNDVSEFSLNESTIPIGVGIRLIKD